MKAEPEDKADLYKEMGLKMTYWPQKQLVEARSEPDPHVYGRFVSEGGPQPPAHTYPIGEVYRVRVA